MGAKVGVDAGGFYFDAKAADRAVAFFSRYLRHTEGEWAGMPFALAQWQQEKIIRPLFGWKRPDGTRRYREAFIFMPRGNGKSVLSSGLGLYLTIADQEPGAQVYAAAGDKDQARVVFDNAKKMVLASPQLQAQCDITKDAIYIPKTGSVFRVISSIADTKHGLSVHGGIIDELHVHPNGELFDVLDKGTRSRRQPLIISITTAGDDKDSFCYSKFDFAMKVLAGSIDADWFLPVIFGAEPNDDIYAEETVAKANPNYPISPKPEYIRQQQEKARHSPIEANNYKRYNLNLWVQGHVDKFMHVEDWLASDTDKATPDRLDHELAGKACYAGLDLGLTNDLTAFVLIFPFDDGSYALRPYFWVPGHKLVEREPLGKWQPWVQQGLIRVHEGNMADYDKIREDIRDICRAYGVKAVAFDKMFSNQLAQQLMADGINMQQFGQYHSYYNEPMREFLRLILSKKIRHGNNEVLTWMAGNLEADTDTNGRIRPKRGKRKDKIDGMAASIMALALAMQGSISQQQPKSVYESRGLVLI